MKKSLLSLSLLAFAMFQLNAQIPEDGLVGRYELDNTSLEDSGPNGYDLQIYGAGGVLLPTDDRFGEQSKALKFVNEYVNMPSNPNVFDFDTNDMMSISVWMRIDQTVVDWTGLINNWAGFGIGGYYLGLTPTQQVRWNVNTEPVIDSDPVATGDWIHVAVTYDGTFSKLYLDGILIGQENLGVELLPSPYSFTVAAQADVDTNKFPGTMDEILVYERALTDQEVLDIYNNVPLSINDLSDLSRHIQIAPNPVKAQFGISYDNTMGELVSYTITDLKGSIISHAAISDINRPIDVSYLAAGAYLLNFESFDGSTFVKRLVKH